MKLTATRKWPIPSGNVALRFYPLLYASFAIKRQHFRFYHKTKRKAGDRILEKRFLKELKATCKNSGKAELKQQKAI